MGKLAYQLATFAAFTFVFWLTVSSVPAQDNEPQASCKDEGTSCPRYLNIITKQGTALVSTSERCEASYEHVWGVNDARNKVRLWQGKDMAKASGGVCVRLFRSAKAIIISPVGGSCGSLGNYFNPPSATVEADIPDLKVLILGCRTAKRGQQLGGIAFRLQDGYVLGDFYAQGDFYSTYDSYGAPDEPRDDGNASLRHFNSYTYEITIENHSSPQPETQEKKL